MRRDEEGEIRGRDEEGGSLVLIGFSVLKEIKNKVKRKEKS